MLFKMNTWQMIRRYISVHKKNVALLLLIALLIVISSITRGTTAETTAIMAGIGMIYAGISLTIWIIRTPSKKDKDAIA